MGASHQIGNGRNPSQSILDFESIPFEATYIDAHPLDDFCQGGHLLRQSANLLCEFGYLLRER